MKSIVKFKIVSLFLSLTVMAAYANKAEDISSIVKANTVLLEQVLAKKGKDKDKLIAEISKDLATVLNVAFTEDDVNKLAQTMVSFEGANNLIVTDLILKEIELNLIKKEMLEEIDVKSSPEFDNAFNQYLIQKKHLNTLKQVYLTMDSVGGTDKEVRADAFVKKAQSHLKKTLLEKYSEKQLIALFDFETSKLGNKFYKALNNVIMSVLLNS